MNATHRHVHACERILGSRWSAPLFMLGFIFTVLLFPMIITILLLHAVLAGTGKLPRPLLHSRQRHLFLESAVLHPGPDA